MAVAEGVHPPLRARARGLPDWLPESLAPVLLAPAVFGAAAAGLWPLWHRQPLLAALTTLVVGVLALTGLVLWGEPRQRAPGLGLVAASGLLELSWVNEWGSGPLPVLSLMEGHGWAFVTGWALYRYPRPGVDPVARRCFRGMVCWALIWPWAWILTSRPNWREYPADAWWPSPWADRHLHEVMTWLVDLSALTVLVIYTWLWIRLVRRAGPTARTRDGSRAAAAVIGALSASLAPLGDALGLPLHVIDMLDAAATIGVMAVPTALIVAVLRRHLTGSAVAGLLVDLRAAPTDADAVRALRQALDDPDLGVGIWSPRRGCYLTADGTPLDPPPDAVPVRSTTGDPLAVVTGEGVDRADPALLAAATTALGLSLENARLLLAARDRLAQVRAAGGLVEVAARDERRRIEQDLHDGAQMRFLALAPLIGAAQACTTDPATSAALTEIKLELRAALAELRRLMADDPCPQQELARAVRDLTARCPIPVTTVQLPDRRLPAEVESTAYLVISEAVTNAVKHSAASRIEITSTIGPDRLEVQVRDDGCGGATTTTGRGLPGLRSRAAAAGGTVAIDSPPGGGTTVTLELPCG